MKQNNVVELFLDDQPRDLVFIFPGGGYWFTSPREALPVANVFNRAGYHAAYFWYREVRHQYPTLVDEALKFITQLRQNPKVKRIFLCGFSAGGHFAGLIMTAKPSWFAGAILCYPVVTSDVMTRHDGSFKNLVGDNPSDALLKEVSIEHRIQKGNPPVFIWHTTDDSVVPVENALVLMKALREYQIPFEAHIFQNGPHGLALANRTTPWDEGDPLEYERTYAAIAPWMDLCITWLKHQ